MKKRVILENGRYWPQYKFVGLKWRYYTEQGDPYRQPEPVSFDDMHAAINYCSACGINNEPKQVVWNGQ